MVVGRRSRRQDRMLKEQINVEGVEVPAHLVRWFEQKKQTIDEALLSAKETMQERVGNIGKKGTVRLTREAIKKVESIIGGRMIELVLSPETRATDLYLDRLEEQGLEETIGGTACKAILINRIQRRIEKGVGGREEVEERVHRKAKESQKLVIVMDTKIPKGVRQFGSITGRESNKLRKCHTEMGATNSGLNRENRRSSDSSGIL